MSSQRKQQRAHRAEVQRVRAEMLGVRASSNRPTTSLTTSPIPC